MKHYMEITALPCPDVGVHFILEKVFRQIHLALVKLKKPNGSVPVGISFPEYDGAKNRLGTKIRLFAAREEELAALNMVEHMSGFRDYVHVTGIRRVPEKALSYASYARSQPKSSNLRLARRKAARGGIALEKAVQLLSQYEEARVDTPFINIMSDSTGRRFRLFILKQEKDGFMNEGFNSYGLSSKSSLPEF